MVGYSYYKDFNNTVFASMIPNCPVTLEDIKSAHTIFRPDFPSLKEKNGEAATKACDVKSCEYFP